jgi:hypothetical protein
VLGPLSKRHLKEEQNFFELLHAFFDCCMLSEKYTIPGWPNELF